MTTIQELQTLLGGANEAPARANSTTATQDRFLKLLITQIQNQDPLNPLDNAQVTTQLAQLNTVTGINQLNTTLESVSASISAQQSLQAAMLVGREVLVPGTQFVFDGQPVHLGADLERPADRVLFTISDAAGNVVENIQTGPLSAGTQTLLWNGLGSNGQPLSSGNYSITAQAISGIKSSGAATLVGAKVESVGAAQDGAVQLQLLGAGQVGIGDIKRYL
jgi:flagellar basal-body rod modification protein FlgD